MTAAPSLVLGALLAASLALNGHMCKRVIEAGERERGKDEVIAQLRREPEWLGKVLVRHEEETIDIESVRDAARQGVRDAMRSDPAYRDWAGGLLPAAVVPGGGLLGKAGSPSRPDRAPGLAPAGAARPAMDGKNQQ